MISVIRDMPTVVMKLEMANSSWMCVGRVRITVVLKYDKILPGTSLVV